MPHEHAPTYMDSFTSLASMEHEMSALAVDPPVDSEHQPSTLVSEEMSALAVDIPVDSEHQRSGIQWTCLIA